MLFGAGEFGGKWSSFSGSGHWFIDNSSQKIGQKNNREVISLGEYCRRYGQNEECLVLAIGGRHLYHVIQQVKSRGLYLITCDAYGWKQHRRKEA